MSQSGRDRIRGQAWTKIKRVLRQLQKLRQGDFVYPDGYDALDQISLQLEKQVRKLERLRDDTSSDVVTGTYDNVLSLLYAVVPMMGFVLRSTNVRNAFEAYDPLRRLCKKLFKKRKVKLILSSDWQFSPVTLPVNNYDQFPDLIFIGLPATEGDNVLLMPLAGHELAHSVWEEYQVATKIKAQVLRHVERFLTKDLRLTSDQIEALSGRAQNLALRQCEEVFCDAFSVRLFGSAAVAAFAYFFAPGNIDRHPEYPPLVARFRYILNAFNSFYNRKPNLTWRDVQPDDTGEAFEDNADSALQAADAVMEKMAEEIIVRVSRIADQCDLQRPVAKNVVRILASYECDCPAEGDFTLGEILEAAWLFHEKHIVGKKLTADMQFADLESLDRLSDIVFKTMEVVEVFRRLSESDERNTKRKNRKRQGQNKRK